LSVRKNYGSLARKNVNSQLEIKGLLIGRKELAKFRKTFRLKISSKR